METPRAGVARANWEKNYKYYDKNIQKVNIRKG